MWYAPQEQLLLTQITHRVFFVKTETSLRRVYEGSLSRKGFKLEKEEREERISDNEVPPVLQQGLQQSSGGREH